MPEHPTIEAAEQFRRALLAMERQQAVRYVQAYGQIVQELQVMIEALTAELALMEEPKAWKVARLARWRSLRAQIVSEIGRFGAFVDTDLQAQISQQVALGLQHAQQMALAGIPEPMAAALRAEWNRLPAEAVLRMMGFLAPGSPLRDSLVKQLGEAVASQVERRLLLGIALGWNPRKIASAISRELGQGLAWALRTARTAQLWAYREANRASYVANSDIVGGWIWHAALDERTCMSCIAMHGTFHKPDEVLNDHHNGRCAMVPVTKTWEELGFKGLPDTRPQVGSGRDWFEDLSAAQQQGYMGGAMWDAWQAGKVDWDQLSAERDDPVYGLMRSMPSLKELLGEDESRKFYRR
jgi:hypothetical protein